MELQVVLAVRALPVVPVRLAHQEALARLEQVVLAVLVVAVALLEDLLVTTYTTEDQLHLITAEV